VKVDKEEVTLGEPFGVTVRIEHPALDVYALPEPLAVEPPRPARRSLRVARREGDRPRRSSRCRS